MIMTEEAKQYVEQRLAEVSRDLENKYKPAQMRIRALEFANTLPHTDETQQFIDDAELIYKYIKEGKSNA